MDRSDLEERTDPNDLWKDAPECFTDIRAGLRSDTFKAFQEGGAKFGKTLLEQKTHNHTFVPTLCYGLDALTLTDQNLHKIDAWYRPPQIPPSGSRHKGDLLFPSQ